MLESPVGLLSQKAIYLSSESNPRRENPRADRLACRNRGLWPCDADSFGRSGVRFPFYTFRGPQ